MPAVFKTYALVDESRSPTIYTVTGDATDVDGTTFVRCHGGAVMTRLDETWATTEADAKRNAADRLDAIAARISAKAADLRREADAT